MKLMTKAQERVMVKNWEQACQGKSCLDEVPVIKLFTPDANATWHLWEYDPEERMFFGLCDLGMGCPELGYVSRDELESVRGKLGLPIERELYGTLTKTFREMTGI